MIRFEKVAKKLGTKQVLNGVTFEIEKGEIFVIVGFSGTGKSVTLRHMVRLLTPDEGSVWIEDDNISEAKGSELARIRSRFGVLFQGGALLQWLSIGDNIGLPLRQRTNMTPNEVDDLVREKLALVQLEEVFEKRPADLSGGMQKRAALARALIMKPEIILYDEPTSGLDPVTSRRIDKLISDTRDSMGVTSVVVTHDLHSALSIGSRIAMLDQGRVVELSKPEDFVRSTRPEVVRFLESQYITKRGSWEEGLKQ